MTTFQIRAHIVFFCYHRILAAIRAIDGHRPLKKTHKSSSIKMLAGYSVNVAAA
jgi:hypothetical protein